MLGDFAQTLLRLGFSGVVAPGIEVNTEAARNAAETFYEAVITQNKTAPEAVQEIHALVNKQKTTEEHKATYLSYLAFAPATLRLRFTH